MNRIVFALLVAPVFGIAAPDFTKEVRPILSRYCFKCHGPDDKSLKGELRLDIRDHALRPAESGERAIVPGKPDESDLVKRIFSTDREEVMPPPSAKIPLTDEQKKILREWVAAGAEYKEHWSFKAPARPEPPAGKHPVDAFVRAKLSELGLKHSPSADAATICRRLYLDLTGLPPKPEDVAAFEKAASANMESAVGELADRLIASPAYGERWARKWLDLARYADTNGYEKDRDRSIWPYRDWVIRALNADMPFDQFSIEQIAGDMLPNATLEQKIATGFHRNAMLNEEGGIDPLEFRYHAMVDRVATTGTAWLGLTVGCAQCHTHKYDPILHTEYFQMMALLNNADEPELEIPAPDAAAKLAKNEERIKKLIAELADKWPLPSQKEKPQAAPDKAKLVADAFSKWMEKERGENIVWNAVSPASAKSNLPLLTVQKDASVFVSGDISKHDTYELIFRDIPAGTTALRLEALPDERLPAHGPGMTYYEGPKGDFFLVEFAVEADGKSVKIADASHSYAKNYFGKNPASAKAATDGDMQTGWTCSDRMGEAHEAVFNFASPLPATRELRVKMDFARFFATSLGRFRISTTSAKTPVAGALPPEVRELLALPDAQLSQTQREALRNHFLITAPELEKEAGEIRSLRNSRPNMTTLVMRERPPENPRPTFLHNRGEFLQPKEKVEPGVLSVLNPMPQGRRDRLAFARWLVSPENPLTARVTVNRAWAAFFGRGIVKTLDDFGLQGESPSHPELLDWLATEFVKNGWSQKKLHRLIVTSETYRQSSKVLSEQLAKDPENKYLARFPRARLEGEMVRDSALLAAGLLVEKIGGPSVRPPQPEGVIEVAYGNAKWNASTGADRYRRSLYTFSKRTAPFALYNTFDAPTGEACIARRDVSNTPLQALTVMNDVVFSEAAQALGKKLAEGQGTIEERIAVGFRRVVSRAPHADETSLLAKFHAAQRTRFESKELDAAKFGVSSSDAGAWVVLARALFNLDEALTKN